MKWFLWLALVALPAMAQTPEGRVYTPGTFERVLLDGSAQVRLTQGEREQVFVFGDAEVQEAVQVRVVNNRLVISAGGAWKFWKASPLQVDIQVRELSQLHISGASNVHAAAPFKADTLSVHISGSGLVRFDELSASQLRFHISGAGDGQIAGQVNELSLHVSGKGRMFARDLRTASAHVSISGVGNAQLWVTDALKVSVSGVGTIDYWGQPSQVSRVSSGLATVNARGDKR